MATEEEIPEDDLDSFEIVENEDGSADVIETAIEDDEQTPENFYSENLADILSVEERSDLVVELIDYITKDREDRKKHDEQCKKALESTGLTGDATAAFSGGSVLIHPVLAQASVDFASAAIKEIFPSEGPVKTDIKGKPTRKKLEKAERKRVHMNQQLTKEMPEYVDSLEKMFPLLCLNGSQYMRIYWWERGKRPRAEYIAADKIYLPYHVSSFYTTQRLTYEEEISTLEYDLRIESGLYTEFEDSEDINGYPGGDSDPSDTSATQSAERKIEGKAPTDDEPEESRIVYNVYCYQKIANDKFSEGYAPYIISINKHTQKLLGIYRNWEITDETRQALEWIVEWPMIPWGRSVYSIGTGHLVGQLARGASGALRALLDSGLANTAPTLFMTKANGASGQAPAVQLGAINQLRTNSGLDDIRKSMMAPPFNPPSNVLYELMGFLVNSASGMIRSTITEQVDATTNVPVGTQLSRIEQGMKVFSAIHKRLHRAQERTLGILHRLNRMYMDDNGKPEDYENSEDAPLAFKSDYEGVMDVAPISDPEIFSEQQRLAQAQTVYGVARENPDICDRKAALKRLFHAMKIPAIDEIIPDPGQPQDENPAAENMKMGLGGRAQALPSQDHLAHIQTHLDFWGSPSYGQNVAIKPRMATSLLNHLVEHMVFYYGTEMQQLISQAAGGVNVDDLLGEDGEITNEMSQAIAAASPSVIEASDVTFAKVVQIISELAQYVDSITPKPPLDPGAAMIEGEKMRAATEEKKTMVKQQSDAQKMQSSMISEQKKLQSKMMSDAMKQQTDIQKIAAENERNDDDNETALTIALLKGDGSDTGTNQNPRP